MVHGWQMNGLLEYMLFVIQNYSRSYLFVFVPTFIPRSSMTIYSTYTYMFMDILGTSQLGGSWISSYLLPSSA